MANPAAGWYPDPAGDTTKLRWWDGTQWTDNYTNYNPQPVQSAPLAQPQQAQQPVQQQAYQQPYQQATVQPEGVVTSTDKTLRLIAFILCIVSMVLTCWVIVPLAWMIPMTVHCYGIYKGTKPNTVGFGVCTLIFCSLIGGILLLVSTKETVVTRKA